MPYTTTWALLHWGSIQNEWICSMLTHINCSNVCYGNHKGVFWHLCIFFLFFACSAQLCTSVASFNRGTVEGGGFRGCWEKSEKAPYVACFQQGHFGPSQVINNTSKRLGGDGASWRRGNKNVVTMVLTNWWDMHIFYSESHRTLQYNSFTNTKLIIHIK